MGAGVSTVGAVWVFPKPISLDVHVLAVSMRRRVFRAVGAAAARPDLEISGYLGLEVLGRSRIIIDTRHQRIRVEP